MERGSCVAAFVWLIVGCASQIRTVWKGSGDLPEDVRTPEGFCISPLDARRIAMSSRRLSPKVVWHYYADTENYYVVDGFFGSKAHNAPRSGVIIDGCTGQIRPN